VCAVSVGGVSGREIEKNALRVKRRPRELS